jgi:recombination protein RecR
MNQKGIFPNLIEQLMELPGIGRKTAQRLAFYILKMSSEEAKRIAQAIVDVKERLFFCSVCNNIAEGEICGICGDPKRDTHKILVVEEPSTLFAIERMGGYKGLYHVLLGTLSPGSGMNPSDLSIKDFLGRLEQGVEEVILATNPTIEGEATAIYLTRLIKPLGIKVSRIATGIPVGADLEYADEVTLMKSLEGRREV